MMTRVLLNTFLIFSINCAYVNASSKNHDESKYGKSLKILKKLDIGPCIDLMIYKKLLYVVGSSKLFVFEISNPESPKKIGELKGLGNVRQIAIQKNIAFIAAREDGLYIIDLSNPNRPTLVYHYDTIEFATGISVSGDLAAVACRTLGIELINIQNINQPEHIAVVGSTEEVQSLEFYKNYLYAGVWAKSKILIFDVSDPSNSNLINQIKLDGYGDGVKVHNNMLFAATGHHSRKYKIAHHFEDKSNSIKEGYGNGHGLEIFSIKDPRNPIPLSKIKTPPLYKAYPDLWSVEIMGNYAIISDTYNGIFTVDIQKPKQVFHKAHCTLPWNIEAKAFNPVGATAPGEGVIYAAGVFSDLYVIEAKYISLKNKEKEKEKGLSILKSKKDTFYKIKEWNCYRPSGQVRTAHIIKGKIAILACGNQGVHIVEVDVDKIKLLSKSKTQGIAIDVSFIDGYVYVAEEYKGLSVWKLNDDYSLTFISRYKSINPFANLKIINSKVQNNKMKFLPIRQIVVPKEGKYAMTQSGYHFEIIDITNPEKLSRSLFEKKRIGYFDRKEISTRLLHGKYASVFWQAGGPVWYDLYGSTKPKLISNFNEVKGIRINKGIAINENQDLAYIMYKEGYVIYNGKVQSSINDLTHIRAQETFNGVPSIYRNTLFCVNRPWKLLRVIDISKPQEPRILDTVSIKGNPFKVSVSGNTIFLPAGNEGLMTTQKEEYFSKP